MPMAKKPDALGKPGMSYIDAESIRQDFIVSIQYAETMGQTREAAFNETAKKYTAGQLSEAYVVLKNKLKDEMESLTSLFSLAMRSNKAG